MMNNTALKSLFHVAVFAAFISLGTCCNSLEWKCDSGQCIAVDDLCDGKVDCSDESDETAENCIQQGCPGYSFRCAYGACVSGSAECNGVQDCADNSDESTAVCKNDVNTRNSNCKDDQFMCTSGECINQDNACDGRPECPDQSDETVDLCAASVCPPYAFKCGYGACISSNKKCNGVPDCRDGSDETRKLCGTPPITPTPTPPTRKPPTGPPTGPPTRPTPTPTPTPTPLPAGCRAPTIPHSRLVYESDHSIVITPGQVVPTEISMEYLCETGYSREGPQFNLCFNSRWYSTIEPSCIKYCPAQKLKGVTFKVDCERDGASVSCEDRIRPGTQARVSCQLKYRKPERNPPDYLVCQPDGTWDYEPFRCEPICGEELTRVTPFLVEGIKTNVTEVPWHVAIYQKFSGAEYKHICGGTIISAKVVISAAHCFWDKANVVQFDKSYYLVGAGKYYRDYYTTEPYAQFQNISEIAIPPGFQGELSDYKDDIAVLVLTNFLRFSPFVAPVCIDWMVGGAKSLPSDTYGIVPGWGIDETGNFSPDLRTIEIRTSSYDDCKARVQPQWATSITNDKFCVINDFGTVECQGDSGGGFTVKKTRGGKRYHYLWGIVSGGVPYGRKCREFAFVSYTNIQYHEAFVIRRLTSNRPK